jgi:cyanophycinase-like exopeptidase
VSTKGHAFLLGSGDSRALASIAERASAVRSIRRVAFSLAAIAIPSARGGGHTHARAFLERAFPGAKVERFAVPGEEGAKGQDAARATIDSADLLFLGGGDPVLMADRLTGSGADEWLRDAHGRGALAMGVSAGSIALAAFWGRWSDEAPDDPPEVVRCVGVAPSLVVDCHSEEDDWAELRAVRTALGERAASLTFAGIGHGAALIVQPSGELEWKGTSVVLD